MISGNRDNSSSQKDSSFISLVLFIILCILLAGICLLREFKKEVPPQIVPPEIVKPLIKKRLPTKTKEVKVALIIDDIGWNREIAKEIERINKPLTLSFLPMAPYSKTIFNELKNNENFELILHLPLEPEPPAQCFDKGLIKTDMPEEEIIRQFKEDIKDFYPYVKGVNNHMGSRFTSDKERMHLLLQEIQSRNMYFVDSMTTRKSSGYELAKEMGIKTAQRDVFIDNKEDPVYIEKQLQELVNTARKEGTAIGIGHARKNTISVLKKTIPEMENEGIEIVPVSALLE